MRLNSRREVGHEIAGIGHETGRWKQPIPGKNVVKWTTRWAILDLNQ